MLLAFHEPVRCPENSVAPLRLRFSISSSLNDSRAGTLRWEFGDGTSADVGTLNEMVEHTYAGPGT